MLVFLFFKRDLVAEVIHNWTLFFFSLKYPRFRQYLTERISVIVLLYKVRTCSGLIAIDCEKL